MICGRCDKQSEPCGVWDAGLPICWGCYNARLDEVLALLPELPPDSPNTDETRAQGAHK